MDKFQVWETVLGRLSEKISRMEFFTWFKKVQIAEISGTAIVLACPTEMNKNWLESKYRTIILSNFQAVLPEIDTLYFTVDLSLADKPQTSKVFETKSEKPRKLPNQPEQQFSDGTKTRITQERFTLSNYIVGEETKFAHAAACAVAESPLTEKRKYNPLFIYGGVGLGKTHLLQGIANEIRRLNPNAKVIYTTAERFMNEIVKSIRERKSNELRRKYRQVDAFLLDDIQFFEGKEKTQEELFNTFNDLYEFNKQIVFSADRPPSELKGISDRLRSRLGGGLLADVQMPNIETRMAILQEKSLAKQIILPNDVLEFIASNVRSNLRELENILNQVSAEMEITGTSPTVQSVGRIFRKLNPGEDYTLSNDSTKFIAKNSDDIITLVSEYFQVPATDLMGTSRKSEIVLPRQIAWVLCKEALKMSYEGIGFVFGGKNHTTIMHGIRKIKALGRKDSTVARHLHSLKKDLGLK
ncbi:chromosomal replication initiator protein DnaA [bacterium DOLZORAL124_38_8]|nr:MAG: chromosomal replication initiator protein DnaA [bacterium DOLZORAL124_38_8]